MKKLILESIILLAIILNVNLVNGEDNTISDGKVVKFDYTLTVDGKVVDSSEGKAPLEYTQGQEMIIPGLESQLEGMAAGEKKTVTVKPEDAYGERDERAVVEVPIAQLGNDIIPEEGMMLRMVGPDGNPVPGVITEVKEKSVLIDFNHPLAGKELTFDVEVVEVK